MKRKTLFDVLKGMQFTEFAEHVTAKTWVKNKHNCTIWVEYSKIDDTIKVLVRSHSGTEILLDGEYTLINLKHVLEHWIRTHG